MPTDTSFAQYVFYSSRPGFWTAQFYDFLPPTAPQGYEGEMRLLSLNFTGFLGAASGKNNLLGDAGEDGNGYGVECWNCGYWRDVIEGGYAVGAEASEVPEPGGLTLAGAGFITLVAFSSWRWRARRGCSPPPPAPTF